MNLFNSVYRFFRFEKNSNILLEHKAFNFNTLEDVRDKDKQVLITSLEQVGKTFLTIPVSLIYLSLNIPVVYLVMDRNQKKTSS